MAYYDELFTNQAYEAIYQDIKYNVTNGKRPVSNPIAVVLGGLPGAGKGNIYGIYDERTDDNIVHIDCDTFRQYHPDAKIFSPAEYAKETNNFVFSISDRLVDELCKEKYNLISESSLKSPRTAFQQTHDLKPLGYRVELAVMASSINTAWSGTIERFNNAKEKYENAIKSGKSNIDPPRPVDKDFFDYVAANIAGSLNSVYTATDNNGDRQTPVDDIYIFTRNRDAIYHQAETPSLDPTPILEARLHNTEIQAHEVINGYYNFNEFSYNTITPIKAFSYFGNTTLNNMADNLTAYTEFFKYYGKVFKHDANVALEFYSQKPDALFIATRDQWQSINCNVKKGGKAIRFVDSNGTFKDYYDLSQIKEDIHPPQWSLNNMNIGKVKAELGISEQTSVIAGIMRMTVNVEDIVNCMKNLNVPENEFKTFRNSYLNAVQLIIAGRL